MKKTNYNNYNYNITDLNLNLLVNFFNFGIQNLNNFNSVFEFYSFSRNEKIQANEKAMKNICKKQKQIETLAKNLLRELMEKEVLKLQRGR